MERKPTIEQHAREILGLPQEWDSVMGERTGPVLKWTGTRLTGAVMREVFTRGPRKGEPCWAKRDLSTEATVTISDTLHNAWLAQWERDTGKCHGCDGTGQKLAGWSIAAGNLKAPCKRCGATGAAPHLRKETAA